MRGNRDQNLPKRNLTFGSMIAAFTSLLLDVVQHLDDNDEGDRAPPGFHDFPFKDLPKGVLHTDFLQARSHE